MRKTLIAWSSGKDSAWMLGKLMLDNDFEVGGLLTSFNRVNDRVAMHAVRRALVELQAERLRLPLWPVELPWPCSNYQYEKLMADLCEQAVAEGFEAIAFGDLFLEDIRVYRERQLEGTGLEPVFPLWKLPTPQLAREMIAGGLKAKLTCVDPTSVDPSFAGRDFDLALLESLPENVDPCGENGEFHTFVYDAPLFSRPLNVQVGETVTRDGFVFADLIGGSTVAPTE